MAAQVNSVFIHKQFKSEIKHVAETEGHLLDSGSCK